MNARLLRPRLSGDPDALRYIAAVQQADGNTLEPAVRKAITDFVVGCKQDGIWSAIKAGCILMGARTLTGALTPLVGSAPTNNGPFVSGDYNRKTGLLSNGSTKYLDSNRANNADPQNDFHASVYISSDSPGSVGVYLGGGGFSDGSSNLVRNSSSGLNARVRNTGTGSQTAFSGNITATFYGVSRSAGASYSARHDTNSATVTSASSAASAGNLFVFARGSATNVADAYLAVRLAFYSAGTSLDLGLLQSRLSSLYTAIGAALAPNYADADVNAYITAVEAADGQLLETGVRDAINDFIVGCKADGIWSAIKASCILMGARTLSGALTPLVGTAPTNVNFVSGDYNRKTGLVGNGSTKYLSSGRANNADGQNNQSMGVYVSAFGAGTNDALIGSGTGTTTGASHIIAQTSPTVASARFTLRSRGSNVDFASIIQAHTAGLQAVSRAASGSFSYTLGGSAGTASFTSSTPDSGTVNVFARDVSSALYATHRIAFYWIGEALTLSLLDSRVSTLYTAIGAAIP